MEYDFIPHTITLFNKYYDENIKDIRYKRTLIEHCKFSPKDSVKLGSTQITRSDNGKLFIYDKDLNMDEYVKPNEYEGTGFTFSMEDIIVIGEAPDIASIKDLRGSEHYTIVGVLHNNYSFVIPHHFSLEVK